MTVTAEQAFAFGEKQLERITGQDGKITLPQNGIVVIYQSTCPHCQRSLENTNMATQTSNGTPVTWIDVANPEGMKAFQNLSGVNTENGFSVGGTSITGVPTTLAMKNGVATEVLKTSVLERGDLDMMAAMQKGKDAAHSTGKVYTYKTGPEAVGASR
mgnify:CR=1 FL=1